MRIPPDVQDPEYLGDAVYIGHDGWHVVLWLESPGAFGPNAIGLEPGLLDGINAYVARRRARNAQEAPR